MQLHEVSSAPIYNFENQKDSNEVEYSSIPPYSIVEPLASECKVEERPNIGQSQMSPRKKSTLSLLINYTLIKQEDQIKHIDQELSCDTDLFVEDVANKFSEYQVRKELYARIQNARVFTEQYFDRIGIKDCFNFKDPFKGTTLDRLWLKEKNKEIPKGINPEEQAIQSQITSSSKEFRGRRIDSSGIDKSIAEMINRAQIRGAHIGHWLQSSKESIRCRICDQSGEQMEFLSNVQDYVTHFKREHGLHICVQCGATFSSKSPLYRHATTAHPLPVLGINCASKSKRKTKQAAKNQSDKQSSEQWQICGRDLCGEQFSTLVELKLHEVNIHGDFDESLISYEMKESSQCIEETSVERIDAMQCAGIVEIGEAGKYFLSRDILGAPAQYLIMDSSSSIRVVLQYRIQKTPFSRICLVHRFWTAGMFNLDLGLAFYRLKAIMELKRVTEIAVNVPLELAWYFQALQFFRTYDSGILSGFGRYSQPNSESVIASLKTSICISDNISRAATPSTQSRSTPAKISRQFIETCKKQKVDSYLSALLQIQMNSITDESDTKAKERDQAITEEQVFDKIYTKIYVDKGQLFDVCKFARDWNNETHYNGLTEPWHGNFIFCNPPFSLGSLFLTRAMVEYLRGKNVVIIIPQQSTQSGASQRLLHLLGTIHDVGLIRFWPHASCNTKACSIVYLIQPDHIDFLLEHHSRSGKDDKKTQEGRLKRINEGKYRLVEKIEVAQRLLAQGVPIREVQLLLSICLSHYDEFKPEQMKKYRVEHQLLKDEDP